MGHDMVVSRYEIPTGILLVDGLLTRPQVLGCHGLVSELRYMST